METGEDIYDLNVFFEIAARRPPPLHYTIDKEIPEILNLNEFFNGMANHSLRKMEELPREMIQKIAKELDVISLFSFGESNSNIGGIIHDICCHRLSFGLHDYFISCLHCDPESPRLVCGKCVRKECFWTHPRCVHLAPIWDGWSFWPCNICERAFMWWNGKINETSYKSLTKYCTVEYNPELKKQIQNADRA